MWQILPSQRPGRNPTEWASPTTVGRAHLTRPSDVRASRASDMGRGRLAAHVDSFGRVRHSGDGQV